MAMRKLGTIAILSTVLLAGCGSQGTSPTAPSRPTAPRPTPTPIGIPPTGAPTAPGAADANRLLVAMGQAQAALKSATCEAYMYCRGGVGNKPKGLPDLGGEWEVNTVYKMQYKAAGERYRIDVTQCTNKNSVGMKMAVKGTRAQVKLSGLLSVLPLSFDLGDKELLNFRGHRLDTGSMGGLAKRFGQGDPDARLVGEMPLDGTVLDIIEIPRAPNFDKTIAREVLGIDRTTKLVRYHAMFTTKRRVYEMKFKTMRPNAAVSDSQFTL